MINRPPFVPYTPADVDETERIASHAELVLGGRTIIRTVRAEISCNQLRIQDMNESVCDWRGTVEAPSDQIETAYRRALGLHLWREHRYLGMERVRLLIRRTVVNLKDWGKIGR
jgi:hypothetical protein